MDEPIAVPVKALSLEAMGFDRMNAQDVCCKLFDRASEILVREGDLHSMAFLFTDQVCFAIEANKFLQSSKTKDALSFLLRKAAGETEILGVALVMEGYMRPANEEEQRTGVKQDHRPVKDHPDRKEAIIVQCEWYTGGQYMLTGAFTKEKDANDIETIKIQEPSGTDEFEGRFANVFPPTRSGGYFH
jgi:hypothetical protein